MKDTLGEAESRKENSLRMEADEHKAKEEAKTIARDQCLTWLNSDKQGKRYLQSRVRNAIEKSVYKLKMTKNAEELGLRKLSQKEALKVATKECQEEKADVAAVEVTNEYIRRKEEQGQIFQKMQEENQRREFWPLRVGASCPTGRHKSGSNWYVGELCHVAVWEVCLEKQRINEQYICGLRDQSQEATRLFDLASQKFESALIFSYDDENVLNRYAETLCQHAGYGASTSAEDNNNALIDYNRKVRKAIAMFRRTENCDGVRALMGKLPQDDTYADLLCEAFRSIEDMNASYLREYVDFIAPLPAAFSLVELRPEYIGRIPNQKKRVSVASDIYKLVVSEKPNFFSRLINLEWLSESGIQTASLIVYIINEVRQGADLRTVDLSRCSDATPIEIEIFSDHVRDVYTLILKSCTIYDKTMSLIGKRCRYLRELDLTGCHLLTDVAMESIGMNCKELKRLSIEGCSQVSDEGVNDIARYCSSLTALNMNKCQFITDESLTSIGEACQSLKELKLSWMQAITDRGIYTFSSYANVNEMEILDLSACRKIGDDGVIGVSERLTNLTDLSLYYCNKITDRGCIAVTHNLIKLKKLSLADLYQITDTALHFDRDGDGRPVIDANMLKTMEDLNLTDCNRLTDYGFASVVTRCVNLKTLTLAGCVGLTDKCLEMIRTNPVDPTPGRIQPKEVTLYDRINLEKEKKEKEEMLALGDTGPATAITISKWPAIIPNWLRGDQLMTLNIAYCSNFTDKGMECIAATCKNLTAIDISGCTRMTDESILLMASCCSCVSHIKMAYCHGMTDVSLHHMSQELWVESLDISHCSRITDVGIHTLVSRCNGITELKVAWCRHITNRSMHFLATECKHLQLLDISAISSDIITERALDQVRASNPTLSIVKDSHIAKKENGGGDAPETVEEL